MARVRAPLPRRALFAVLLAASVSGAGQGAAAAPPPKPRTHTVVIEGTQFQPEALTVRTGDTIVWVNKDLFPHSATAANGSFDSQVIAAGASWKYTVTSKKKGDVPYTCIFHPTMKATLHVK